MDQQQLASTVLMYSILEVIGGLVFWVLAVVNTVTGRADFDFGIVLFIGPIVTGFLGIQYYRKADQEVVQKVLRFRHRVALVVSHTVISLVFFAHIFLDDFNQIFVIVFFLVWAFSGILFESIHRRYDASQKAALMATAPAGRV